MTVIPHERLHPHWGVDLWHWSLCRGFPICEPTPDQIPQSLSGGAPGPLCWLPVALDTSPYSTKQYKMVNSPHSNKSEEATVVHGNEVWILHWTSRQLTAGRHQCPIFDSEWIIFLPILQSTVAISKVKYYTNINKLKNKGETISDFIGNQLFVNMFWASLRPSSGGQTAFSLPVVFCPVKGNPYEVLCYGGRSCIV